MTVLVRYQMHSFLLQFPHIAFCLKKINYVIWYGIFLCWFRHISDEMCWPMLNIEKQRTNE